MHATACKWQKCWKRNRMLCQAFTKILCANEVQQRNSCRIVLVQQEKKLNQQFPLFLLFVLASFLFDEQFNVRNQFWPASFPKHIIVDTKSVLDFSKHLFEIHSRKRTFSPSYTYSGWLFCSHSSNVSCSLKPRDTANDLIRVRSAIRIGNYPQAHFSRANYMAICKVHELNK